MQWESGHIERSTTVTPTATQMYMDFVRNPDRSDFQDPAVQAFRNRDPADTYNDAEVEKVFRKLSEAEYAAKVLPGTQIAANTGNTYCGSVYASLLSLISNVPDTSTLLNKRILLFSYGSGLASTMLSIRVAGPLDHIVRATNIMARLEARTAVPVDAYLQTMARREAQYNRAGYVPKASSDRLAPGTYYLTDVNDKYHRSYALKL